MPVFGREKAEDAAVVAGIGNFRDHLHRLDIVGDALRAEIGDYIRRQFDFKRQRRRHRRQELRGFFRIVEHRGLPLFANRAAGSFIISGNRAQQSHSLNVAQPSIRDP